MSTTATAVILSPRADERIQWLLDGDPAIRWQVSRDLVGEAERTVERERRKVARDGWGARLLARQDPEDTWAGGLYSRKWTSTTYMMLLLLFALAAASARCHPTFRCPIVTVAAFSAHLNERNLWDTMQP